MPRWEASSSASATPHRPLPETLPGGRCRRGIAGRHGHIARRRLTAGDERGEQRKSRENAHHRLLAANRTEVPGAIKAGRNESCIRMSQRNESSFSGFSISAFRSCMNLAASQPSTTRWSQDERQVHQLADLELAVDHDRRLAHLVDRDDRDFRPVDHRRRGDAAHRAEAGDGEGRAATAPRGSPCRCGRRRRGARSRRRGSRGSRFCASRMTATISPFGVCVAMPIWTAPCRVMTCASSS